MLSQTAEYAMRAAVHLASLPPDSGAFAGDVARELGVPVNYLSKILHQLAAAGILLSRRGRHGGFQLAVPAAELTLADIVAPFDDVDEFRECLLGRPRCTDRNACPAHARWKPIATAVLDFLQTTTVADLARRERAPAA